MPLRLLLLPRTDWSVFVVEGCRFRRLRGVWSLVPIYVRSISQLRSILSRYHSIVQQIELSLAGKGWDQGR